MPSETKTYIAIDLKSFFASAECVERGLDPLTQNLVVADLTRTEKTICLAVSPALKAFGIPGRPRLFEVVSRVAEINAKRRAAAPGGKLTYTSTHAPTLQKDPLAALDYTVAPPHMALYMAYSRKIYGIYTSFVSHEDIHVYSIDEVFIDATSYLRTRKCTARAFAMELISAVLTETGITATAGIGPNLYLCKVAMDITAKHIPPDENGVRIAELDVRTYRETMWNHKPITDFWRVGPGYAKKLEAHGMYTMGDVARCSMGAPGAYYSEELLFKLFGVGAELLIDHAWGEESCTIADIKAFKPASSSLGAGQVLSTPYSFSAARLVLLEMADQLSLELVDKGLVTDQIVINISYDAENLSRPEKREAYSGPVAGDRYGRAIPKPAHGSVNLSGYTASTKEILRAVGDLFDRTADKALTVRQLNITANRVVREEDVPPKAAFEQLDLFTDYGEKQEKDRADAEERARERRRQVALLSIKKRFGKNAILRGMSFEEGATARERNGQIGGHKA